MSEVNIISISGGKDSTAMALLALERDVLNPQFVFADTGHEHPQTYDYVKWLESVFGHPIRWVRNNFRAQIARKRETVMSKWVEDGVPQERIDAALDLLVPTGNPFLDLCIWKGRFPSTRRRFCSEELKHEPIDLKVMLPASKQYDTVISWQGVRADESRQRANLTRYDEGEHGVTIYRPILHWTVEDVFAQHRKHNVSPNPLYKLGMGNYPRYSDGSRP